MELQKEKELIQQAKAGKAEAYGQLIQHYQQRLYRRGISLLGDPDIVEDVLQTSFLSAYYALKKFRGESSIYTWLYRILTNKCNDRIREHKKEAIAVLEPLESIISDGRINLEKNTELSEDSRYLMNKVNDLSEKYRQIVLYHYYDGLSYEEIAQLTCTQKGTVKSRLFKARDLLRKAIIKDGRESDLLQ